MTKLVKQLMTGIGSVLRKWHNTVIPLTDKALTPTSMPQGGDFNAVCSMGCVKIPNTCRMH